MNKYLFVLVSLACLLCLISSQKPAPLWPQHFSQAFHITGEAGKLNSTGKIFYDYTSQLFRTQYDNGVDSQCQYEFQRKSKCVQLYKNQTVYLFMPEESICCHYPQQKPPKRDFLRQLNFIYKGEEKLDDNVTYDMWQSPTYAQNKYFATKDGKQVPRRFALGQLVRDYLVSSFNDGPINPNVFLVPSYCKKSCNGVRKNKVHGQGNINEKIKKLTVNE